MNARETQSAHALLEDEFTNAVLRRDPMRMISRIPVGDEGEQITVIGALAEVLRDDDGTVLVSMLHAMSRYDPACVRLLRIVARAYADRAVQQLADQGAL